MDVIYALPRTIRYVLADQNGSYDSILTYNVNALAPVNWYLLQLIRQPTVLKMPFTDGERFPSVCLVTCYFGELPGWMAVFLRSCAHNPTIDFIIFTDQETLPVAPRNVTFVPLHPSSFETLAATKLGIDIRLNDLRKICDFKPLYGLLFDAHLTGADYWGYADLDVIYGSIRRFLNRFNFSQFDVFTARREYLVGHFTLFRNNEQMRYLFQKSADVATLLQSDRVFCFDECGEQCLQILSGKQITTDPSCDSMTHVVRREVDKGVITARFERAVVEWPELRGRLWRLRWYNGHLWQVDTHQEFMYFHFHAFKSNMGYRQPRFNNEDDALEISAHGITGCIVNHVAG